MYKQLQIAGKSMANVYSYKGVSGLIPKAQAQTLLHLFHTGSEDAGSQAVTKYFSNASSSCITKPLSNTQASF